MAATPPTGAREALKLLAAAGLDVDRCEYNVCALIAEGEIGPLLKPAVATERAELERLIELAATRGEDLRDLDDTLTSYSVAVTEAAFLFGVIAGAHVSWPMIAAMPAPYGPPPKKAAKVRP